MDPNKVHSGYMGAWVLARSPFIAIYRTIHWRIKLHGVGNDAADCLRYLVATKPRVIVERKLTGL
jgi:hypothetical protein